MTDIERVLKQLPRPAFVAGLSAEMARQATRLAPTTVSPGPVVGVLADTHCATAEDLPAAALTALAGCDLIVHCGDIGTVAILDRLEAIAPVVAVRSGGDASADGRRLFDGPRLVRAGSLLVGIVSHVGDRIDDLASVFGTSVDVVLTGTTHRAEIVSADQTAGNSALIVNPGSPTLPFDGPPSVAVIDGGGHGAVARIIPIGPRKEQP